jgi:CheY-like chemotaxis protein
MSSSPTRAGNLDILRTVLVVEDNVALRMPVGDVLRGAGYRVVEAANTGEAMTILSESRCDLTYYSARSIFLDQ